MKTCATCRFFFPSDDASGICRRYPPAAIVTPEVAFSHFPPMLNGGWCGEFKPNEETEK